MAESEKPKWFHKLGPKPALKRQDGIIGPVEHKDIWLLDVRKTKISEKSYMSWTGPMIPF